MNRPTIAMAAIVITSITSVWGAAAYADSAQPPADPAAQRAGDANLESLEKRRGYTGGISIGPSVTLGAGTGNGGAVSLRLGQVATPSTVITFELNGSAQLKQIGSEDPETWTDSVASFLVGGQFWVGPSLWVRAAGGAGVYTCGRNCEGAATSSETVRRAGVAGAVGVGIDVARFKGLVLALELYSVNQLNRNGLLSTNAISMALSFD